MKFLIVGFGSIGRRHFRNLLALGERDIVLCRSQKSLLDLQEIKDFPIEYDLTAALAHRPDAVIIANPTALHVPVAHQAIEANCAVFMEKPVSDSYEDALGLFEQSGQKNTRILTGFQFRFHPGLIALKELIHGGQLGTILSVQVNWGEYLPGWHPWEDYRQGYAARKDLGGGVVRTLSHPFDYLTWMFGQPTALSAQVRATGILGIEVDDLADVDMIFSSEGLVAHVHLDYHRQPGCHTLEVVGSAGTAIWDNADGALRLYLADQALWKTLPVPDGFERNTLFMAEMSHFIQVVDHTAEPLCTLFDGLINMKVISAVFRSSQENRTIDWSEM